MTDEFVYTCRGCGTATVESYTPPDRECPVCGVDEWSQRGQIR